MMTAPILHTERLAMRPPGPSDLDTYAAFNAVSDTKVGKYRGGRTMEDMRSILAADIAHWDMGFGMWMLTLANDEIIGGAGLDYPDDWLRPELTWWLMPDHRGAGYATEASRAVIKYGYDVLNWPRVETCMRDENLPARKLAERLGGKFIRRDTVDGVARDVFALPHPGKAQ